MVAPQSTAPPSERHYLVIAAAFLGHWKPLLGLLHRLMHRHVHLRLTLFLPASQFKRATVALRSLAGVGEDLPLHALYDGKIRFIAYGSQLGQGAENRLVTVQDMPQLRNDAIEGVEKLYPHIIDGKEFTDDLNREVEPWPLPLSAVIWDFVHSRVIGPALRKVEEARGVPKPLYLEITPLSPHWMNVMIYDHCEPQPIKDYFAAVAEGTSTAEAYTRHVQENAEMMKVPDCAPMHVYEIAGTGDTPFLPVHLLALGASRAAQTYNDCYISYSSAHLGRENIRMWPEGKQLYQVGMFQKAPKQRTTQDDSLAWLDQAEHTYGERSVAYVSFGSLFFSPTPSQIPLLISSLVERGRPALISLGNCKDEDAQELRRCAQADHRGLIRLEEWVNQEAVLAHPAVAWFMTHAGQGAVTETLMAAVPTIVWPCGVDQPFLANQLSQVEKVGIELVQVRLSEKGKTLARGTKVLATDEAIQAELRDAMARMDGPEAADFRCRAEELKDRLVDEQREGGEVDKALDSLGYLEPPRSPSTQRGVM